MFYKLDDMKGTNKQSLQLLPTLESITGSINWQTLHLTLFPTTTGLSTMLTEITLLAVWMYVAAQNIASPAMLTVLAVDTVFTGQL